MIQFLFGVFLLLTSFAHSETRLDGDTDGMVIVRLEQAVNAMDANDPSRIKIFSRLGDLYSDRARISEMNETAKNIGAKTKLLSCKNCRSPEVDREHALENYRKIFYVVGSEERLKLLQQMIHLLLLNGKEAEAEKFILEILKNKTKYSPLVVAQGHASLADILYRRTEFKRALDNYKIALSDSHLPKRAQVLYRMAWSLLNLDRLDEGKANLEFLLRHPSLFADVSFYEEVSRDYATFLARGEVDQTDIDRLVQLSPQKAKLDNVHHLANELDRLGKKASSLMTWKFANTMQTDPKEKIESHIKMAQVQYDLENTSQAAKEIEDALEIWENQGCKINCDQLKEKLRRLLYQWDRGTKNKLSMDLFKSYQSYVGLFDQDTEVTYAAANFARRLGENMRAAPLFRRSATLAKFQMARGSSQLPLEERQRLQNVFEGSLLSEIESAELAKDLNLRLDAYKNYLAENPKGARATDVRYQIVHIAYEKGDYQKAATGFRNLVVDSRVSKKLRLQSADLAMDSLSILKDEEKLELWGLEFSKQIPEREKEYLDISRKAALNRVAAKVNRSNATDKDFREGLEKMNSLSLSGMSEDQKLTYLRDKITVARRARNVEEVRKSATELLNETHSPKDNIFALKNLLWVADMTLDFATAYHLTLKLCEGKTPEKIDELNLAIYADLANLDPSPHFQRYLKFIKDSKEEVEVMASLIRHSKNPTQTFRQFEQEIKRNPDLYINLALKDLLRTHDYSKAALRFSDPQFKNFPEASLVTRLGQLHIFKTTSPKLSLHKLANSSLANSSKSIRERMKLLDTQEKQAAQAIQTRDWTLQIIHLDFLAKENSRFFQELHALPIPNLKPKAKDEYIIALAAQAAPFEKRSLEYRQKFNDLWEQKEIRNSLLNEFSTSNGSLRQLMSEELQFLVQVAPDKYRKDLQASLDKKEEKIDLNRMNRIMANVREDPFNKKLLDQLKELKQREGDVSMVSYLETRMQNLDKSEL